MRHRQLSRRTFLRSSLAGGTGLAAVYLLGCGDGDGGAPTPGATAPLTEPVAGTPEPSGFLQWTRIAPEGDAPAARRDHSLVSDGERLVLFGGRGEEAFGDTWRYDIAANSWDELTADPAPAARLGHNAAWDVAAGRIVLYGGQAAGGSFFSDLWSFDPATSQWSQVDDGSGPSARYGAAGALDPEGRLVISHGFTAEGRFDDTWRYDFAAGAWEEITPAGERPVERCLLRGVWTQVQDKHLLLFGGQTNATPFLDDLWALEEGRGWVPVQRVPHPGARNQYSMVYDATNDQIAVFGGDTDIGPVSELWWFDARDEFWTQPPLAGDPPPARFGHDAAWASSRSAMFVFGGNDGAADLDDLWELTAAP